MILSEELGNNIKYSRRKDSHLSIIIFLFDITLSNVDSNAVSRTFITYLT